MIPFSILAGGGKFWRAQDVKKSTRYFLVVFAS